MDVFKGTENCVCEVTLPACMKVCIGVLLIEVDHPDVQLAVESQAVLERESTWY